MDWSTLIIIALALTIGLLLLSLFFLRRRHGQGLMPLPYSRRQPRVPFFFRSVDDSIPFHPSEIQLEAQSQAWQDAMSNIGQRFDEHDVSHVYFVHGTFAGDDPFGVIPALQKIFPRMKAGVSSAIKLRLKRSFDRLHRDSGNYLLDYVSLFKEASACRAQCQLFVWSSGNHHAARLRGALSMLRRLNLDLPDIPHSRVVLWGHSHAGQVFAIFSHLLHESPLGQGLWSHILDEQWASSQERRTFSRLRKFRFDVMTFGSPLRYPWRLSDRFRLVSVVNHRGQSHLASYPFGFWKTQGGDYIQQWGTYGSDHLSASSSERLLNRRLDKLLGTGVDPRGWIECISKGVRVSEYGVTYLIDYHDQAILAPNGLMTIFGHGVYTKFKYMLFNSQLCCDAFFPDSKQLSRRSSKAVGSLINASEIFFGKKS